MKRVVILLLAVAAAGCMALVPDDMRVTGFEGVNDAAGFWVRDWEAAGDKQGVNFRGTPQAFKDCAGQEAVKMSPPALTEAIGRFIANKNAGNYKALVPMVRKFSSGYEEAYGVLPGVRAGELCKDKLQA
jgi:hypothetical protein